jgi:uncharacterized protein YchJ
MRPGTEQRSSMELLDSGPYNRKINYKKATLVANRGKLANKPCVCGTGKKYKKCCGREVAR